MKTKLIPMGRARGLRIPKAVIEQCGLTGPIEMLLQGRNLVIQVHRRPRSGWEEAFAKMALRGDDKLLDPQPLPTQRDVKTWQWK